MLQAGSLAKCVQVDPPHVANAELGNQLRAAAVDGDDARIARLVSELLRCKGLSRSQRIALQQRALLSLVQSLRSRSHRRPHRIEQSARVCSSWYTGA